MKAIVLKEHLKNCKVYGNLDVEFFGITHDSRKVKKGDIFVAITGKNDGHNYIQDAIKRGAVGVVVEKEIDLPKDIFVIKTNDSKETYGYISNIFFDFPSNDLKVVGITGTMGKTTIAYLLYRLFNFANIEAGFIGTIGIGIKNKFELKDLEPPTTPFPFELNKILKEMRDSSVKYVFMEVSSHGIKDKRIFGINFYKKILASMGIDHLDFHETVEDYINTKVSFFYDSNAPILNGDAKFIERFVSVSKNPIFYGEKLSYDFSFEHAGKIGLNLNFNVFNRGKLIGEISTPLVSTFNERNFTAVLAFALLEGIPFDTVKSFAKNATVPGRMEVYEFAKRKIIIDYAHNPDEIESVLESVSKGHSGNVIVVFGAVGTSNREKRIEMGKVVSKFANFCYLTSDDPRGKNVSEIIEDIEKGISIDYAKEIDRREAIRKAIKNSKENDLIVILGRGVESVMHLEGGNILKFRDSDIVEEVSHEL